MATTLEELKQAVIDGQAAKAKQLTEAALAAGERPEVIFPAALFPAMEEVGKRLQAGDYFIPEVLMAAKAMKSAAAVLKPRLAQAGQSQPRGRVVMGTVKGDLHDIGKNLVVMMLEGAGFAVTDLGIDVPPERFAAAVKEVRPHVLGMSAMLTTTMLQMAKVIQALQAEGVRSQVRVMVGGAPLTQAFAAEIGADAFGMDSTTAVELAKAWTPAE